MSKVSNIIQYAIIDLKKLLIILIILSIISSILIYVLTSSTFRLELQFVFINWIIDISAGLTLALVFIVILEKILKMK